MFEDRRAIAVCGNGHLVDSDRRAVRESEPTFCDSCGERVIEECPDCGEPIQGHVSQAPAGQGPLGPWIKEHISQPDFCPDCGYQFPWGESDENNSTESLLTGEEFEYDPNALVARICRRFPIFINQLNERYNNREGIQIEDEYDVQDVLHPILRMFFDDVRPEEGTESYAGGSSRIDFLLKQPSIGIEVKFMHTSSSPREIGDELLADENRYAIHSECEHLISFIYDPNTRIPNPNGMEEDLTDETEEYSVTTIVAPKGE